MLSVSFPIRGLCALLAVLVTAASGCGEDSDQPEPPTPEEQALERAVDVTDGLSGQQLIGQRILLSFEGTVLPAVVADQLAAGRAAGVVLFERNYLDEAQFGALVEQIHDAGENGLDGLPPLVMVDQEGGEVRRLPAPPRRSALEMGADLTEAEIEAEGEATGSALSELGVNVDLAPVADIGRPGGALLTERRVFSDSADVVTRDAAAFAAGLESAGVSSTAKHFPGFGSAQVNTDQAATVVVRSDEEALEDLEPFEALIAEDVDLVMLSTATYPELEDRPAALSPAVVDGLLRGELGFEGVTITDALDTPTLDAYAARPVVAVEALDAPVDLLIYAHSTQASLHAGAAGVAALKSGQLSQGEARGAAGRVVALRALLDIR